MSASIFSFSRQRTSVHVQAHPVDWTTQELAELYRVSDRLVEAGLRVSLCRGLSDEGEPWAIFERDDGAEVIVHIARIDGYLVVVNNTTNQVYKGVDFRAVTEQMLIDAPLAMPRRQDDPKVVYHPRAVFTAFVAAAVVVTEMARNIESAEASEATDGTEATLAGSGLLGQLMARFLSRDSNQPLQVLAAGSGAFGIIGAAALAVEMLPSSSDGQSAVAVAGKVTNVATYKIDPALSAAIENRNTNADEASTAGRLQAELADGTLNFQSSSDRSTVEARDFELSVASSSSASFSAPLLVAQQELTLPVAGQFDEHPFDRSGFASAEHGTSAPLSGAAPSEPVADAAVRPSLAERQKITEALFVDTGRKGDDGAILIASFSSRSDEKIVDKDDQERLTIDPATVIAHVTSDGGIYILDDKVIEHVIYDGGHAIIHNFQIGQDQIQINHMDSSGDWFRDFYVIGNDIHLVGVDGGSITLYDSFHTLA